MYKLKKNPIGTNEERFFDTARKLGADENLVSKAWENVSSGKVLFLVLSGKMGSGKDTVAPVVLVSLGVTDATHLYYASALKDEADRMFEFIKQGNNAQELGAAFDLNDEHSQILYDAVAEDLWANPELHSRNRSGGIRLFLQVLGTDVRRAVQPDYWVNICMQEAVEQLAAGNNIFLTDARYPNEIEKATDLGAFAVRLELTEDTQEVRLLERDGVLPEKAALDHISENALNDFDGFSLVLDNNGPVAVAVHSITKQLS